MKITFFQKITNKFQIIKADKYFRSLELENNFQDYLNFHKSRNQYQALARKVIVR